MANYFVDSTTGSDGDDGTTMDLAWATIKFALESGGLVAGDFVWVRRLHVETPTAIIQAFYNGYASAPIEIIGWPRAANTSISSATWTQGSTTVDNIVGLSIDREKHLARFITGPDGFNYLITKIVDSDTILIDRGFIAATVSGASGAATILADEMWVDDMGAEYNFNDSGWTIKETDWDADAEDLPFIDCLTNNQYFNFSSDRNHNFRYLDFTSSSTRAIQVTNSGNMYLEGCLFVSDGLGACITGGGTSLMINRTVIVHTGGGGSSWGLQIYTGYLLLRNAAIYDINDSPFVFQQTIAHLENVNIGIEGTTGDEMIYNTSGFVFLTGIDVNVNISSFGIHDTQGQVADCYTRFENFGKVFGVHVNYNYQGTLKKFNVVGGSGDPYKRSGGADHVIEVVYDENTNVWYRFGNPIKGYMTVPVFTHEFEVNNTSKNYRYYVQCDSTVQADELWIEAEYVSHYDGTTRYGLSKVVSDETISNKSGPDDWSQYIEVTGIQPAVHSGLSLVRIRCYCRYYHETSKIYIDPNPEIT